MIKVMSVCTGLRTRHVSIICFALAVRAVVCEGMELKAFPLEVARCGENVTLKCEATISDKSDIMSFVWDGNKTCKYADSQPNPEVQCERTDESPYHRITLTLINVMPVDQGTYICKLRSKRGVKDDKNDVKVKDCLGSSDLYISKSDVTCWFDGVYPSGIIHWFQGDVNLTDSTTTHKEEDHYGRYYVSSTIGVQNGTQSYRCSLWIPSDGKYLSSHVSNMTTVAQLSSGSTDRLQWSWIMVAIIMVTFIL